MCIANESVSDLKNHRRQNLLYFLHDVKTSEVGKEKKKKKKGSAAIVYFSVIPVILTTTWLTPARLAARLPRLWCFQLVVVVSGCVRKTKATPRLLWSNCKHHFMPSTFGFLRLFKLNISIYSRKHQALASKFIGDHQVMYSVRRSIGYADSATFKARQKEHSRNMSTQRHIAQHCRRQERGTDYPKGYSHQPPANLRGAIGIYSGAYGGMEQYIVLYNYFYYLVIIQPSPKRSFQGRQQV